MERDSEDGKPVIAVRGVVRAVAAWIWRVAKRMVLFSTLLCLSPVLMPLLLLLAVLLLAGAVPVGVVVLLSKFWPRPSPFRRGLAFYRETRPLPHAPPSASLPSSGYLSAESDLEVEGTGKPADAQQLPGPVPVVGIGAGPGEEEARGEGFGEGGEGFGEGGEGFGEGGEGFGEGGEGFGEGGEGFGEGGERGGQGEGEETWSAAAAHRLDDNRSSAGEGKADQQLHRRRLQSEHLHRKLEDEHWDSARGGDRLLSGSPGDSLELDDKHITTTVKGHGQFARLQTFWREKEIQARAAAPLSPSLGQTPSSVQVEGISLAKRIRGEIIGLKKFLGDGSATEGPLLEEIEGLGKFLGIDLPVNASAPKSDLERARECVEVLKLVVGIKFG